MKHSTIKRLLSALLVLVFAFVLFPAEAYADLQDEIDELRKERLQIAEEHEQKQAVVDQLEEERAGLLERKLAMDERNELTRKEIENIEKEIALYDQMIAEAAIRVEQAKAVETEQLERYRVHVRAMEENGELGYLALILNANTLSELLTAVDDAGDIMRSDVELYDAYIAAREHTEEVKAEYEQTRAELEAKQEELRVEQEKLEAEIEEANRLITELDEDIERRNEELHELLLAEIETAEKIDNLVAEQERQRQEEERRRQQENGNNGGGSTGGSSGGGGGGGSVTATGSWGWPCPGCTYITSRAGNRFHPIFNEWRYHSGLDIGASHGSAVVASDSGTVIMAL